jgi:hypothetical protein
MAENSSFSSECPRCKHQRSENGYELAELIESLDTDRAVDAYCLRAMWCGRSVRKSAP